MIKAHKYRLYPNINQAKYLDKMFGCNRFAYNWALDLKIKTYQQTGVNLSAYDLINMLPDLKNELVWLKESDSKSLQQTLFNLDQAYTNFFRKTGGFPKFKSKKRSKLSYTTCILTSRLDFNNKTIHIPKVKNVKFSADYIIEGTAKTVTISKSSSGEYYTSVIYDDGKELPQKPKICKESSLGIDLGLTHFATFSNGEKINNPKFLAKEIKKLQKLSRKLSRKQKGSKNKDKARIKVARFHERVANKRLDFLHKLTFRLTHENQVNTICLEDLGVSNMMKNHCLARSISDVSWYAFKSLLKYKSEWYGKNLIEINRFEPSSKICNHCGTTKSDLKLSDREWTCSSCQRTHDRDVNAAKNIRDIAINPRNLIGMVSPEFTLRESNGSKRARRTKKTSVASQ